MLTKVAQAMKVFIVLADGFAEESIVTCLCRLRDAGLEVDVVGPGGGLIKGGHGLWIRPDLSLEQMEPEVLVTTVPHALVLCGGGCSIRLMADPRVHRVMAQTLQQTGLVVILGPGAEIWAELAEEQGTDTRNLLVQGRGETVVFVETLINRLLF